MKIPLKDGSTFYMEKTLYDNLMQLKLLNEDDYDSLILLTGPVGSGKSTLGIQILTTLVPDLNIKNITFNGEQFEDFVRQQARPKFDGVQLDEAIDGMASKEHYRKVNLRIERMLATMRLKNMYMTACMPRLKDFSDFTINRARLWIKCFTVGKKRGFFVAFGEKRLRVIYYAEKKRVSYRKTAYNFRGRFMYGYGNVGKKEYEKAKELAFLSYGKNGKDDKRIINPIEREAEISFKLREQGMSLRQIGSIMGKNYRTVQDNMLRYADSLGKTSV